jgi:hypothetical protein
MGIGFFQLFLSFFSHAQDRPFLAKNLDNPNAIVHLFSSEI